MTRLVVTCSGVLPISLHTGRAKVRVAGAHAGLERAVADAFEHPGSLRVNPSGLCEACQQTARCIGNPAP